MPDDTPLTELVEADIERVDGVLGPANGLPFLVMKAQEHDPVVQATLDAVLKAAHEPLSGRHSHAHPAMGSQGDDGTHEHEHDHEGDADHDHAHEVEKAEQSTASINDLPDSAFAYIEPGGKQDDEGKTTPRDKRHFPVHDAAHVRNALSRAPQSPFGDKAMPKIKAAAKKFGVAVSKAEDEPGSAGWESEDAAALRDCATQIAVLCNKLAAYRERERAEVTAGDGDDMDDVYALSDALGALQSALSIVATMAVTEAAEGGEVTKSGRRLSAKSQAALTAAITTLQQLQGDGPSASTEEPAMSDETTTDTQDVTKSADTQPAEAAPVAKAADEPEQQPDQAEVLKSIVADAVKAAVTPLEERIAKMEEAPRPGGPRLRGATLVPVTGDDGNSYVVLKGQQDTPEADGEIAALRKSLEEEPDPQKRAEIGQRITIAQLSRRYGG